MLKDKRGNYTVYKTVEDMDEVRQLLEDGESDIFVSYGESFSYGIRWDTCEPAMISITKEDFYGLHGLSGAGHLLVHRMFRGSDISTAYCCVQPGVFARNESSEHVVRVSSRITRREPLIEKSGDNYRIAGHIFTGEQIKKALNIE